MFAAASDFNPSLLLRFFFRWPSQSFVCLRILFACWQLYRTIHAQQHGQWNEWCEVCCEWFCCAFCWWSSMLICGSFCAYFFFQCHVCQSSNYAGRGWVQMGGQIESSRQCTDVTHVGISNKKRGWTCVTNLKSKVLLHLNMFYKLINLHMTYIHDIHTCMYVKSRKSVTCGTWYMYL